jgi:hypothetical protein
MSTRHVGRLVSLLGHIWVGWAGFVYVASCGSSAHDAPTDGLDASTVDAFSGAPAPGPTFSSDSGTQGKSCKPQTCAGLGYNCGVNGDGCGGTVNCSKCSGADVCGVGGYSKCGNPTVTAGGLPACTPTTCSALGYNCGKAGDGCGNVIDCGPPDCGGVGICGGGGFDKCGGIATPEGGTVCVPGTCASFGYNCGMAGDGCGGMIGPCGSCTAPLVCGAGGKPDVCGSNVPCTGLCQQQVACDGGVPTTITGTVRAGLQQPSTSWVPANTTPDPVPGVLVYIPSAPLAPFDADPNQPRVQCQQCDADVSGSPLVSTKTDFDGTFTLTNVPVSASSGASDQIPVVIQLGRWRREFFFTISNRCGNNAVPDLNMPSTSAQGDIPLTAISTGSYDPIECVLLKMGVAQSEFTSYATWQAEMASGTTPKPGRVHIYTAASGSLTAQPGSTLAPQQDETVLMGSGTTGGVNGTYMMYDQILLPCWGDAIAKNGAELANLGAYGDHGGHFFATHYSYTWLDGNQNSALTSVANWDPKQNVNILPGNANGVNFTGNVSSQVPVTVPATNPGMFVKWLNFVGALSNSNPPAGGGATPPTNPTVSIIAGRHDVDSVLPPSVNWINGVDPAPSNGTSTQMLLHFTFDMPIATPDAGSPTQCGHGIYSDFHVNSANLSTGTPFPRECNSTALDSQERIIEYMIWDLASCVPGPPTSSCTPLTCVQQHFNCGSASDGCGNLIPGGCGVCAQGLQCGAGGMPNVCPPPTTSCTPIDCKQQNIACGPAGDGCGNLIPSCGTCTPPQTCGGGGVPGQCGTTRGCTPLTCQDQKISCGPAGDGCGNAIPSCGTCVPPQTCGGGGVPGKCGMPNAK